MTNDYQSLIHLNPYVPYASNGFQRSHWCNMVVMMDASVKQFNIFVYANSAQEATFYATQLKQHIEMNPMSHFEGQRDDISIGLRAPVFDAQSHAYMVSMVMNAGMLQFTNQIDRFAMIKRDYVLVVHNGEYVVHNGKFVTMGRRVKVDYGKELLVQTPLDELTIRS